MAGATEYREPGDDCTRMKDSIVAGWMFVGAVGFLLFSARLLLNLDTIGLRYVPLTAKGWIVLVGVGTLLLGLFLLGMSAWFIQKEIPHWSARAMTADRFLAGVFIFGLALIFASMEIFVHSHHFEAIILTIELAGVILGASLCLGVLGVGLLYAFAERFKERPRTMAALRVERRYGLDDNLVVHEDYCTPHMDGMEGIVVVKTREGRRLVLQASESAYEFAEPGKTGAAVIRGKRLDRFSI